MSLIERLFGREAPPAPVTQSSQVYPTAVPYLDGNAALALSAVWRCVTLIADTISDQPWNEWDGDEDAPEKLPASRLVRQPMATMTRRDWTWRVVATEALYNACHLLHVGGYDTDGTPWSLLPIPPRAITPGPLLDPWGILPPETYIIANHTYKAEDVTVIRRAPFPGVYDHLSGILTLARREFSAMVAADIAHARYWQAGGPITTVITTDQELTPTEAADIGQRWVDRRTMGADFPAVLGKGAEAKPWGADPTTDSAVDARNQMVADIGRYFGVQPRTLNAPAGDSQTYANVEDDAVDLERYTLRGYAGPIEDAISMLLPGDYITGRRMRLDSSRLTQGNLESRARSYPLLVTGGILTVDEARRRGFGLGPIESAPATVAPPEALPGAMVTINHTAEGEAVPA